MHECAQRGLSFFYDGLNPRSGIGGESPFSPSVPGSPGSTTNGGAMLQTGRGPPLNNTGGLFLPGWTGVHAAKLHMLTAVPATLA